MLLAGKTERPLIAIFDLFAMEITSLRSLMGLIASGKSRVVVALRLSSIDL
jgi:hypothetical protein